ncbi:hypothetical protein NE237_010188 [Protea cynaroides]|uniref:PGG domain-containing protein n=1 Tax=Protea cynaroides TaxID=273540 RepID=A0A9Q0R103_9MAGN|nr:hypothetical protein NE237_010188 [Protea cynaroides]
MDIQIYTAAKLGNTALFRQVVNQDYYRLLKVTPQGNTAMHVSVRFGHIELVKEVYAALVLQHNSSLEGDTDYSRSLSLLTQVNSVGDTALHIAAKQGHVSIAEFLIQKILPHWYSDHDIEVARGKIRMRNNSNYTAIHEAIRMNDLEMVKTLIKAEPDSWRPIFDADVEAHGGPHGRTALHEAVIEEHPEVVEILLQKKGRELVNKVDENGRTALHYAASQICHSIVQQLLRHDTYSAYQLDEDGLSPLHIAALKSSISVLIELIQCCPDAGELLDKNGRNVLHFAVMSKDSKKIRFILKQPELKELINQADVDGNTPCHLAAKEGSSRIMGYFYYTSRLDLRATNNNGQTAADIIDWTPIHEGEFLTLFRLALLFLYRWQYLARSGEEKWMIRGASEDQIGTTDPNKQAEAAKPEAAKSEIPQHQKEMGNTLQIVASLIATVTFTAVYQVPGGYNEDGTLKLLNNPSFQNFLQYDALAMSLAIISLFFMFLAPVGGKYFYSASFKVASSLIWGALICTSIAFFEGYRAVLPPCGGLFCLSSRHANKYVSAIKITIISYIFFLSLLGLFMSIAFWKSRFIRSRYAKFKRSLKDD